MPSIKTAPACDARILVAGVGGDEAIASAVIRAELLDIRYARYSGDEVASIPRDLDGIDMLVVAATAGRSIDRSALAALAQTARDSGVLIAAIVVMAEAHDAGDAVELAVLREAVDMLMVVRDADAIPGILRSLR